jgi:feruloyl esterase
MKIITAILLLFFASYPFYFFGQDAVKSKPCLPCEQLKDLRLPDVKILKAQSFTKDTFSSPAPWLPSEIIGVPFCKVSGTISKEIDFELLLPQNWDGRFLMSGGGGFVGSIQNDLINYVNDGYVTVGTNTGHKGSPLDAEWALNNMERQINFGRLAVHRTATVSKSIINSF